MWDLLVSIPDHCLSFYFIFYTLNIFQKNLSAVRAYISDCHVRNNVKLDIQTLILCFYQFSKQ